MKSKIQEYQKIKKQMMTKTKATILLLLLIFSNIQIACKENNKETAETTTSAKPDFNKFEWVDIDASKTVTKYPIIVKARKGAKTENSSEDVLRIENEDMITNYEISGYMAGLDQEMKDNSKKVAKENDSFKFEKFIIDTPDSYIMKTSIGYLVGRFIKAGEITYECNMAPLYALENEADAQELYKIMGMLKAK